MRSWLLREVNQWNTLTCTDTIGFVFQIPLTILTMFTMISRCDFSLGVLPGCEEGEPSAVQVSGQILPRRRVRGADPGHHPEALFPAGEGEHPERRGLLPTGNGCAAGLLLCSGQVRRLLQGRPPAWLPHLWPPAAPTVRKKKNEFNDVLISEHKTLPTGF